MIFRVKPTSFQPVGIDLLRLGVHLHAPPLIRTSTFTLAGAARSVRRVVPPFAAMAAVMPVHDGPTLAAAAAAITGLGLLMGFFRRDEGTIAVGNPVLTRDVRHPLMDWTPAGPFAFDRHGKGLRLTPIEGDTVTLQEQETVAVISTIAVVDEMVKLRVDLVKRVNQKPEQSTLLLNRARAIELGILDPQGQLGRIAALSMEPVVPPEPPSRIRLTIGSRQPVALHLVTGEPARYQEETLPGIAAVTDIGLGHDKTVNEDRFAIRCLADGRIRIYVMDGIGSRKGAERAAELARAILLETARPEISLDDQIRLSHAAIGRDNELNQQSGRANRGLTVVLGYEVTPTGGEDFEIRFARVGDAEAVGIRLTGNHADPFKILFTEGRYKPEEIQAARFDPRADFSDGAIGDPAVKSDIKPHPAHGRKGDIVLSGSDGFFENFATLEEIASIIARSGETAAREIRRVLMQEVMIRMRLFEMMRESAEMIELTHERYLQAYTDVTGVPPPAGWLGAYEGCLLTIDGFVGRPKNLNPVTQEFHRDPATQLPMALTRFKGDNVTFVVQILGEPEA